jgi:hypothetical protein
VTEVVSSLFEERAERVNDEEKWGAHIVRRAALIAASGHAVSHPMQASGRRLGPAPPH